MSEHELNGLYSAIGVRIRIAREECKMTQAELADMIGLTRTSVTNIEAGRQKYNIEMLYAISAALGASVYELLPRTISNDELIRINELRAITDQIEELRQQYRRLRGQA